MTLIITSSAAHKSVLAMSCGHAELREQLCRNICTCACSASGAGSCRAQGVPLSRTFCAGALHSWLLHQVAPRVAAPRAGAGSSIVRDDWYLRHRGLALSGANRLCRGHLQKWGLLWLCFLSSSQVVPVTATTVKPLPHPQRGRMQQADGSWVRADAGS